MEIVILDGYTENPGDLSWSGFERLGELTVHERTNSNDCDEILRRIGNAEIILTNKTPITREIIKGASKLKYIGVLATGYNVVDVDAAKELGITVTNVPAYSTEAVAQFAIGLLLEICHHIGSHDKAVKDGRWSSSPDFCFWDTPLIELAGKTMGIVGYGRIGRAVGRIAEALEMKVLAYDPAYLESAGGEKAEYVELDELYARSDIISLHCPLLPQNKEMINKNSISKMKDGVIIINNSRGGLIAEADLAEALNTGKVYAAGLDVVSAEPIDPENVLLKARNCIITPHISWASKESRARLMEIAVENLNSYLVGQPINVVC